MLRLSLMGESKRSLAAFLKTHPECCFCGGVKQATTRDHQPARALFDRKEWPEGYEFPACEECNAASRRNEHVLAVLVRLNSDAAAYGETQRRDFQKYIAAMSNNFPNLLKFLNPSEKRRFFKQEGITKPSILLTLI